jgi:preprotein translocase subunit SecA
MATGEGKTLAAVAPVVLHALCGRGAHVLTFNDYLARRDALWMGPVYEKLALRVGFVQERDSSSDRRRAYAADVTYLTAKEAGFDHLRDALALEPDERVQREFHFALVDEADSILIDEARIPLVIAGETGDSAGDPARLAALVRDLVPGTDFDTDEHAHNIALTEEGAARVESALGCGSLHALENVSLHAQLRHALHAERAAERMARLRPILADAVLADVERRLTLLMIDRCWSDQLAELRELREDSVLVAFAGRFPMAEFHREAGGTFQALESRIQDEIVRRFESLEVSARGVDWEAAGLRGPSATWTYLVGENPFGAPWLVLLHGMGVLWARRRRRRGRAL